MGLPRYIGNTLQASLVSLSEVSVQKAEESTFRVGSNFNHSSLRMRANSGGIRVDEEAPFYHVPSNLSILRMTSSGDQVQLDEIGSSGLEQGISSSYDY
jgi:hypothetical protein